MQVELCVRVTKQIESAMGKDGLSPLQILFRSDKYERAGIDVSSRKSTVAVPRPFSEVVKLVALAEQLKSIEGETRVVMEHTGRYYESVRCAP